MEKWELILKYDNAVERIKWCQEKIRNAPINYPDDAEVRAGHVAGYVRTRDNETERALGALKALLA